MRKIPGSTIDELPRPSGFALIELLVMLLILGGLGAIAAFGAGAFSLSTPPSLSGETPTTSSGQPLAEAPSASVVTACNSDARTVESAVTAFEAANNGEVPTIGDLTSTTHGGPYLNGLARDADFTISLDSSGSVLVSLGAEDPAATAHLYPTDKAPFREFPVDYDTWLWSEATTSGSPYPSTANVCEGA